MANAQQECQQHQEKFIKNDSIISDDAIKRVEYMWKTHVYKVISVLKADRGKKKELGDFLLEQIGFFQGLLGKLQVFPHSDPEDVITGRSSLSLINSKGKKQRQKVVVAPSPKDLELIARLHIYIGDLFRYKANYQNALLYYSKSLRFSSSSWAYNQMGVVYHSLKDLTLASHFYMRAIYHPDPFPSSRDNLSRLKDVVDGDGESALSDIALNALSYTKYRDVVNLLNTFGFAKTFGNLRVVADLQKLLAILQVCLTAKSDKSEESDYLHMFSYFILESMSHDSSIDINVLKAFLIDNLNGIAIEEGSALSEIRIPEELGRDLKNFLLFDKLKLELGKKLTVQDSLKDIVGILSREYGSRQTETLSAPSVTTETHHLSAEFTQAQRKDVEDDVVLFKGRSTMSSSKSSSPVIGHAKMDSIVRRSISLSKHGSPIGFERQTSSSVIGKRPSYAAQNDPNGYNLFPQTGGSIWNNNRADVKVSASDPIVRLGSRMSFSGLSQNNDREKT